MAARRFPHLKAVLCGTVMYAGFLLLARLWHLPCVFQWLFGVPCPGCGMTRAWLSVLRGQLTAAFAYHPLFWTVPLLYGYLLADGHLFRRVWVDRVVLGLLLAALGVLGVGRILCPGWRPPVL